jgi:hypothetical protein
MPDPRESFSLRYLPSRLFLAKILTCVSEFLQQNPSQVPSPTSSPPGSPITFAIPVPPPYHPTYALAQQRLFFAIRDGSQNLLLTNE